jgi:hypothetical protein
MNCKQGDLAIVVSVPLQELRCWLGKIVRVKALTTSWDGYACWMLETPVRDPFGICEAIADRDLRPIRPQSDDAVDEMVRLVGAAPKTLTEVREVSHG